MHFCDWVFKYFCENTKYVLFISFSKKDRKKLLAHLDLDDLVVDQLTDGVLLVLLDVLLDGVAQALLRQHGQLIFLSNGKVRKY